MSERLVAVMAILAVVTTCLAPPALALVEVPWIYTVEVPVAAQSEEERQRAAGEGLLVVLGRVSGLASVPRSELVTAALETPDRYYDQFVFFTKNETRKDGRRETAATQARGSERVRTARQTYVKVSFQPAAVLRLAREAELPIWWSQRPQVMAWVAINGDGPRRLVTADRAPGRASPQDTDVALRGYLDDYARARGIPVALPEARSLQENNSNVLLTVTSGDVWRRDLEVLREATLAREAQIVAVARMQVEAGGTPSKLRYGGEWRLWLDDEPITERFRGATVEEVAAQGAAFIANALAAHYAVLPRPRRQLALRIEGIDDIAGYAQLMRYLATLEFLERYQVDALRDRAVFVAIETRAETAQLSMLLTQGERLIDPTQRPEPRFDNPSISPDDNAGFTIEAQPPTTPHSRDGLRLVWQG